jgi:hypothetical protein
VKTQIIHLDPHDDVASVRDKVTWSKAQRLVLVWPGRSRILVAKLDLRLIQRHAARHNTLIGIVSLDPDVTANARSLGIPVFDNLNALDESTWIEEHALKQPTRRSIHKERDLREFRPSLESRSLVALPQNVRWGLFSLALCLILLVLLVLLPSAEIIIEPSRQTYTRELLIPLPGRSDAIVDDADLSILREDRVLVEGTLRIATTGITSEPGEFARGEAEFTNLTDEPVTVPAQSTIREPGSEQLYFITQTRLRIPAEAGTVRSVEIVASLPGTIGNIPAGQITAVDGELGLLISVENPEPTTGGSIISSTAVSASDLSRAKNQLSQQLLSQAEEIMRANQLPEESWLSESVGIQEVLSEQADREIGETADTILLEMSIIAHGFFANTQNLSLALPELLSAELGADEHIAPESLNIRSIQLSDPSDKDEIIVETTVSYETYRSIEKSKLGDELRGMRPGVAYQRLAIQYPHAQFKIKRVPAWYPLLPFFKQQITASYPWEAQP